MTMFGSPWFGSAGAAFTIDQSCRFDSASSSYFSTTYGSAGNRRIGTVSCWFKRASIGTQQCLFNPHNSDADQDQVLQFNSSGSASVTDSLSIWWDGANYGDLSTTQAFTDTGDWNHLVATWDTTQATAADRNKIYFNGTEITSLVSWSGGAASYPTQNREFWFNGAYTHAIGRRTAYSGQHYFDGYLAEVISVDGTAYAPSQFGETVDSVWVPKNFSGSYGTNGFYLDFADSADLGADQSGNSNDFTSSGLVAADQVLDSPMNNFAVWNPSDASGTTLTYSEGNLKAMRAGAYGAQAYSSMSFDSGKWYAEVIFGAGSPPNSDAGMIAGETNPGSDRYLGQDSYTYAIWPADGRKINNGSWTTYDAGVSITKANDGSGDVLGIYIDADNGDLYFSVNGAICNSGTAAFTGVTGPFRFAVYSEYSSFLIVNFGQDDTFTGLKTSGSAAASDDDGYGKFYDTIALAGYLAPCSKNGGTV